MSFNYRAYGLGIHSEIPLPELVEVEAGRDVTIELYRLSSEPGMQGGSCWKVLNREEAILQLEGLGTFQIHGGRQVTVGLRPGADPDLARAYLLGLVMAVLLYQRGKLVLHASAVVVNGSAVAFLGHPGWGKSTTAAAQVARGHRLLTDDVMPIEFTGQQAETVAAFPRMKLDPGTALALGFSGNTMQLIFAGEPKRSVPVSGMVNTERIPLKCVFVLSNSRVGIKEIRPADRLIEIIRHSYPVRLFQSGDAEHFRQCGELAKRVPIHRLCRGEGMADVAASADLVEDSLR